MRNLSLPSNGTLARIEFLDRQVSEINVKLAKLQETIATRTDVTELQEYIRVARQPNWSAIGVAVAAATALGIAFIYPINTSIADAKILVASLTERSVTHRQYEIDQGVALRDRQGLRADINTVATTGIQQQRYNSDIAARNQEMALIRAEIERRMPMQEYEKRHDDLKELINNIRAGRAAEITNMLHRIDRLENLDLKGK